jgi:hypothetical protein
MDSVARGEDNIQMPGWAHVCVRLPGLLIQLTQAQNKKGFRSLKPSREQSFRLNYFTTAAESTTAAAESTTAAAESTTTVATESTAAAASSFLAPQATIATAKPQTIRDAIIFFIVYRLFEFGRKDIIRTRFLDT